MKILGIESSCDETGLAIYDSDKGLLAEVLYSQIAAHKEFGGVVPEIASRDHNQKLLPLLTELMSQSGLALADLDGIAYTHAPGLQGALLVGAAFAKSLAYALNIPALGVHHLEAHMMAVMLEESTPAFPFLMLLVSGGHSQLLAVRGLGDYALLGDTLDDACGEAFDKTAKLLGLPYPGGPALAKLATTGDDKAFTFSKPMVNRKGLDFSFSGLKTQVANAWHQSDKLAQTKADIAASFEKTICDTLVIKCKRALAETGFNTLVCAGGVGANKRLRQSLKDLMQDLSGEVFYPRHELCTDNGAMIAYLGWCYMKDGAKDSDLGIKVHARLPLSQADSD